MHGSLKILSRLSSLASDALPYLIESLRYRRSGIGPSQTKWLTINAINSMGEYAIPYLIELIQLQIPKCKENAIDALYAMGDMAEEAILKLRLKPKENTIDTDFHADKSPLPLNLAILKKLVRSSHPNTRLYACVALNSIQTTR